MKETVNKKGLKKKAWIKPEINSLPFKGTRSGVFLDTFEDATYATS